MTLRVAMGIAMTDRLLRPVFALRRSLELFYIQIVVAAQVFAIYDTVLTYFKYIVENAKIVVVVQYKKTLIFLNKNNSL